MNDRSRGSLSEFVLFTSSLVALRAGLVEPHLPEKRIEGIRFPWKEGKLEQSGEVLPCSLSISYSEHMKS